MLELNRPNSSGPLREDTAQVQLSPPRLATGTAVEPVDIEALLSGDHREFEKMVRAESPRLFRIILRIVRDENEAESVMQEAFLQAFMRLQSFRREAKFSTWLYAIAINLAKGSLRKSMKVTQLQEEDIDRLQPTFVDGHYVESYESWKPDKVAELEDRKRIVHEGIDRLPEDYRSIVILRDIEELPTAEAAAILNISEGAARVRLHRARQALRAILDGYFR